MVTAAMGCASLLGEASAFSPSSSSSTTVIMMEARLSPSPSFSASSRSRSSKDAHPSSVATTLWYRNGDGGDTAQDLTQDEQQRSTNLVDSPRSSGLIPYLLQRCKITKNPHNSVKQEDQEDYDLTSYLQYVNKRYERLHLDDEVVVAPQEKTRKMVPHNQESLISTSFQPSSTQHSDALYALNWAGHFAEQIHAPWTNGNIKDVAVEELDGTEFESVASSSTRVSKRLSLIAKVSSVQARLLAMQFRTIAKIAGLVLDRARKLTELLAKRGAYRVKLAMSLATVLFLVTVRPVTSVVSKS